MNNFTNEQLEEMDIVEPFDKAMFLSGITEHSFYSPNLEGYIVSEEKMKKFAQMILENNKNFENIEIV